MPTLLLSDDLARRGSESAEIRLKEIARGSNDDVGRVEWKVKV